MERSLQRSPAPPSKPGFCAANRFDNGERVLRATNVTEMLHA